MKPFCYRAFDFRNRFEDPFQTVLEALKALYSDGAYLPEISSSIIAYFEDGKKLKVPNTFHILQKKRFEHPDEATKWLQKRNTEIDKNGRGFGYGVAVAHYEDDFEKQLEDAMSFFDSELNKAESLTEIAKKIEAWISENEHLAKLNRADKFGGGFI